MGRAPEGLHHVELWVPSPERAAESWGRLLTALGWSLLFADRHPYAGGRGHYAAYLADRDGFEVELVATG